MSIPKHSRATVIAIVLFLCFDFLTLGLNIWVTMRIESQAVGINLAGRQRMLSQRMVKTLLQLDNTLKRDEPTANGLQELQLTFRLFDDTLRGFSEGHITQSGTEQEIFLPAVSGQAARYLVEEANHVWAPYRERIVAVLEADGTQLLHALPAAVTAAERYNLQLLSLMNRLTSELERETQHEAQQVRLVQSVAFLLALLNALVALVLYQCRMKATDQQKDLLDEIINRVSASILVLDEAHQVVQANRTAENMFGYGAGELNGLPLKSLLHGSDGNQIGKSRDGATFMAESVRQDGEFGGRALQIVTISDVTLNRKHEAHLTTLAYHDLLTQLPNRMLFDDRLQQEIAHAQRHNLMVGVMFLDLDHFKPVNDRYGHDVGDQLLREVARRLQEVLRETDTVSRRSGDEFTLLISDAQGRESLSLVADKLIACIEQPICVRGIELHISVSIGISQFPIDGADSATLLAHADEAMYRAKQHGRGRKEFYSNGEAHAPTGTATPPGYAEGLDGQ